MAFDVHVQSCAGHRDEETPRRFTTGARSVEIEEVIDRWQGPDHRYFKVRGGDGAMYILRHDTLRLVWEVVVYQRDHAQTTKHDHRAGAGATAQPRGSAFTSRESARVRH